MAGSHPGSTIQLSQLIRFSALPSSQSAPPICLTVRALPVPLGGEVIRTPSAGPPTIIRVAQPFPQAVR